MATVSRDIRLAVIADVRKFTADMAKLPDTTQKQASAAGRKMVATFAREQERAAKKAAKIAKTTTKQIEKSLTGVDLVGSIISAEAIKAGISRIAALTGEVMELRTELADLSARSGIATDTLAGLRLAAAGSGLEFTELNDSLASLPKRMADAARGTGEGKVAFDALGISVTDVNGNLRDADDVFREFIKGLEGVENPAERAALTAAAFGESGTKLLQALGDPGALEDFIALSTEFGADVGPEAIKAAQDWTRANAELKLIMSGVTAELIDAIEAGERLEAFTVGLVFTLELAREAQERFALSMASSNDPLEELAIRLAQAERQETTITDAALAATKAFVEQRDAVRDASAGTDEYAGAADGAATSLDRLGVSALEAEAASKALREEQKRALDILRQLGEISAEAASDQLTAEQEIRAALEERLVDIRRLEREALSLAQTEIEAAEATLAAEVARTEATAAAERELAEIRRELAVERNETALASAAALKEIDDGIRDHRIANRQVEIDEEEELRDAVIAASKALVTEVASAAGEQLAITQERALAELDAEIALAEGNEKLTRRLERQKKALILKQFKQSKAANIAQIGIATALASITMISPPPTGLGPIFGPPFAVATGALALGAAIGEKAPVLHVGGLVPASAPRIPGGDPDERMITARVGERVDPQPSRRGDNITLIADFGGRTMDIALRESRRSGTLRSMEEPSTLGQRRFVRGR